MRGAALLKSVIWLQGHGDLKLADDVFIVPYSSLYIRGRTVQSIHEICVTRRIHT